MQETPAAAGEDTPGATTTRGDEAAPAATVVADVLGRPAPPAAAAARPGRLARG